MLRKNEIVSYDLSAGHIYMRRNGHDVIMTIDSLDTQSILLLELIEQITDRKSVV